MRLESLRGDIRFVCRIFRRSPTVALTVIGTLAVALGLNLIAYSFFNAYVVTPAAVRDPGTDACGRPLDGAGVHPRDDGHVRRGRVCGRDRHRHRRRVWPRRSTGAESGGRGTIGGAANRIASSRRAGLEHPPVVRTAEAGKNRHRNDPHRPGA